LSEGDDWNHWPPLSEQSQSLSSFAIRPAVISVEASQDGSYSIHVLLERASDSRRVYASVSDSEEFGKTKLYRVVDDWPRVQLSAIEESAGFERHVERCGASQAPPERFAQRGLGRRPRPDESKDEQRMRRRAI
jgi:hypothetical protein